MPPGIGYGGVSLLRSMFAGGAASAGRGAASLYARQGAGMGAKVLGLGAGAAALRFAGQGMKGISRMGNVGVMAATGAIAGGVLGGLSPERTALGGMMSGAAIGASFGMGLKGARAYGMLRARGVGARAAAGGAFSILGRGSRRFLGSSYSRAVNGFNTMRGVA